MVLAGADHALRFDEQDGEPAPYLHVRGGMEARLVRAERWSLAGLEEGTWRQGAPVEPFLSRPMRARLQRQTW